MKLSLILSSLLVGASLLLSGCGSSDDSTPATNDATQSGDTTTAGGSTTKDDTTATADATEQIEQFTTEMLAGKTFYSYGMEADNSKNKVIAKANMQFNFSADASTVEGINLQDGENYGSFPATIDSDKFTVSTPDGEKHTSFLLTTLDGEPVTYDQWLTVWSTEQQSDNGEALLKKLQNDQKLTVDKLTANPWYMVSWAYDENEQNTFTCDAKVTIDSNGTITYSSIENGVITTSSEYNAKIASGDANSQYFLAANPNLIYYADSMVYFKNISDAKVFIEEMGATNADECVASYPTE